MRQVGLVLGGGGVLGQAFHVGVLAALAETGWDAREADLVLGTSAGSQIGALLRAGVSGDDLAAAMSGGEVSRAGARLLEPVRAAAGIPPPEPGGSLWPGAPRLLTRLAVRPWRARVGLVIAAVRPTGRRSTDCFVDGLEPLFGDAWPDRRLWIPAIRLDTGELVVFGRAGAPPVTVGEAVAASCAVPGFFAPVPLAGGPYVDGGCHSPTNLDLLAGAGLDEVIVSSPLSHDGLARPGGVNPVVRLFHRLELELEVARVRRKGTRVVVFQPDPVVQRAMGSHSMDHGRVPAVVEAAREQARNDQSRMPK